MKHWVLWLTLLALVAAGLLWVAPAYSFLLDYVAPRGGGTPVNAKWDFGAFAVQWNLNPAAGGNLQGNRDVAGVTQASFNTWVAAPNTTLSVARGADSNATALPPTSSGINLICFVCNHEQLNDPHTLGITFVTMADAPGQADGHGGASRFAGQILNASILFNPAVNFSTGNSSGQDLQTVVTHEVGHFFGLDHSAVVRAMMFPASPDLLQSLSYDDVAGMSTLYPKGSPDAVPGSIAGTVRMASGSGVFGAHVYADSVTSALPFGGAVRKSPISTFTLPDGSYTIRGVPPDSYLVVAEPLDDPVTGEDVSDFAKVFGRSVQTNFTTRWH